MSAEDGHGRQPTDVVVGFDGSQNSVTAVEWAANEAAKRGARLRVLTAAHYPGMPSPVGVTGLSIPHSLQTYSDQRAQEGRMLAAKYLPESEVDASTVVAAPWPALVEASAHAALVVVGHRGHGAFASALLGSVSTAVAEHARCPVVVVRGFTVQRVGRPLPVTVGVDGTDHSEAALRFAAHTAARDGVPLHILCAATFPSLLWEFPFWDEDIVAKWTDELSSSADAAVKAATSTVRAEWPDLVVEERAAHLAPGLALEEVSRHSSLVVVGASSTGLGGRFPLGSVSRTVLHHSSCPVAVVRPPS